ncbi:uncharacterized protein LOC115777745 [Archocentrus centrarchus]|uniref:uncharacterized protein LOC115777745 n=1 Tax=Archocentrus centrarchus TaxID=63155 RepID=UPI0011E9E1E0|nr:uncharacterized protein LOC115777745 [Archocentrus centrarchus]
MLGDLGRHGTGPAYEQLSKTHGNIRMSKNQNYTQDNRTQGIMEKSQWDLKKIRFQKRRLTRLDDFVRIYQKMHDALLLEYADTEKTRKKSFRVETEKWKNKRSKRKGVYVSPLVTGLPLKKKKSEKVAQESPAPPERTQHLEENPAGLSEGTALQVSTLWKKKTTEVVVSVVPSQIRGNNLVIRHSELLSLRPHSWLVGEVIECLLHQCAIQLNLGNTVYVMNHYTSGVILFGKREMIRRHSLSKVNFDNYKAIVSFVNIGNIHWKFLYINAADSCLYLVDPTKNSAEKHESDDAAERFREYFKMRRTCHNKTDWVDVKLRGGVMPHPCQRDGSSCGVLVIMVC